MDRGVPMPWESNRSQRARGGGVHGGGVVGGLTEVEAHDAELEMDFKSEVALQLDEIFSSDSALEMATHELSRFLTLFYSQSEVVEPDGGGERECELWEQQWTEFSEAVDAHIGCLELASTFRQLEVVRQCSKARIMIGRRDAVLRTRSSPDATEGPYAMGRRAVSEDRVAVHASRDQDEHEQVGTKKRVIPLQNSGLVPAPASFGGMSTTFTRWSRRRSIMLDGELKELAKLVGDEVKATRPHRSVFESAEYEKKNERMQELRWQALDKRLVYEHDCVEDLEMLLAGRDPPLLEGVVVVDNEWKRYLRVVEEEEFENSLINKRLSMRPPAEPCDAEDWLRVMQAAWHEEARGNRVTRMFKRPPSSVGAMKSRASHRDTGNFERSELDALMAEDETTSLVASVTQANAEDWRAQMRQAWTEEIQRMDDTKAQWYHTQVREHEMLMLKEKTKRKKQRKERERREERERKIFIKQKKEFLKNLEKYSQSMKESFMQCGMTIRETRLEEKQLRIDTRMELRKIRMWHDIALVKQFLLFAHFALLKLLALTHLHDQRALQIQGQIDRVPQLMEAVERATREEEFPDVTLKTLAQIDHSKDMRSWQRLVKAYDKQRKKQARQYTRMRQACLTFTPKDRAALLEELMLHTEVDEQYYHEWHHDRQTQFNRILLSVRFVEGMKIQKLFEAIDKTCIDEIPPAEIVSFLQVFTEEMAASFDIKDEWVTVLRLYIARAVYRKIFPVCFQYRDSDYEQLDTRYRKQVLWQRRVPPASIDGNLAEIFAKSKSSNPFAGAIAKLEDITLQMVPTDMLMGVHDCMRMIHQTAREVLGGDLGADDLFPLWIYVTIHADLFDLHRHLAFMQNFSFADEGMSRLGYCLTTFVAAVNHVCMATPRDYGFIDMENLGVSVVGTTQEEKPASPVEEDDERTEGAPEGFPAVVTGPGTPRDPAPLAPVSRDLTEADKGRAHSFSKVRASQVLLDVVIDRDPPSPPLHE